MPKNEPFVDDETFGVPRTFLPIGDACKDGERQVVRRGPNFAAAQWTGDFWSYPIDPTGKHGQTFAHQIDFEPTHYMSKDGEPMPEPATATA